VKGESSSAVNAGKSIVAAKGFGVAAVHDRLSVATIASLQVVQRGPRADEQSPPEALRGKAIRQPPLETPDREAYARPGLTVRMVVSRLAIGTGSSQPV
jgi:hypothetical protein